MAIKLYTSPPSPPGHAVRLMLEAKGLDYETVELLPGLHPMLLRTRGFRGGTVPAMKLDGRKIQHSRAISRALNDLQPEPPLFPHEPEKRLEVEEAEKWAEEELQNIPRRIVRWLAVHRPETRVLIGRDAGVPFPALAARLTGPQARYMANKVDSDREIQFAIAQVPMALDHADDLIDRGVIGGDSPNAADYQIATNVRALMTLADLAPLIDGRPSAELAKRICPPFGAEFPAGLLPAEWVTPTGRS